MWPTLAPSDKAIAISSRPQNHRLGLLFHAASTPRATARRATFTNAAAIPTSRKSSAL
jgi:hypothetical protein